MCDNLNIKSGSINKHINKLSTNDDLNLILMKFPLINGL